MFLARSAPRQWISIATYPILASRCFLYSGDKRPAASLSNLEMLRGGKTGKVVNPARRKMRRSSSE
jgi:hypothetical protein